MFGFFKKKKPQEAPPPPPPPVTITRVEPTIEQKFAASLYALLAGKPGNAFFSSYSIAAALSMARAGAAGPTREEIVRAIGDQGPVDVAGELCVANAIWHQTGYPIRPEYVAALKAEVRDTDFAGATEESRGKVNAWAAQATRDKIREVLPPGMLTALTRVLLANAIYFKARWESVFEEHATRPSPFTRLDGSRVDVPMMNQGGHFRSVRDGALQALEMPYQGLKVSMVLLLPDAGTFEREEKALDPGRVEGMIRAMTAEQTVLSVPKFRIESNYLLREALASLGIVKAFTSAADFTPISSEPGFALSEVVHRTYVDVNEWGTEAAAVTIAGLAGCAPPKRIVEFRCDRPFVFIIRDRATGAPIFMGRVVTPSPSG